MPNGVKCETDQQVSLNLVARSWPVSGPIFTACCTPDFQSFMVVAAHVTGKPAAQSLPPGVSSGSAKIPPSASGAAVRAESAKASTRVENVFVERAISTASCWRMICQPKGAVDGPRRVMRKTYWIGRLIFQRDTDVE